MGRTLTEVLGTWRARITFFLLFILAIAVLFLFVERTFLYNVATGGFPLWLWVDILPTMIDQFLFADPILSIHYLTIALLASAYTALLVRLFVTKRYLSLKSFGMGIAGFFGISLGISCLSCGALAGLAIVSLFGVSAAPAFLLHHSTYFLIVGEVLLAASVGLLGYTVARFNA
jgi:hypothetical protein